MEHRLRPFVFDAPLRVTVFRGAQVNGTTLGEGSLVDNYGFKEASQQHNFWIKPPTRVERLVVVVWMATRPAREAPTDLSDARVVARLFGTMYEGELVVWHLSVNRTHPLNNSEGGRRWGHYGLHLDSRRWVDVKGVHVTKKNCHMLVRGTPNPFATYCLYRSVVDTECNRVSQKADSPCALLFVAGQNHDHHPPVLLIYRALAFERAPGLDHYVWDASVHKDMFSMWHRCMWRMRSGWAVVSDAHPHLRATSDE